MYHSCTKVEGCRFDGKNCMHIYSSMLELTYLIQNQGRFLTDFCWFFFLEEGFHMF